MAEKKAEILRRFSNAELLEELSRRENKKPKDDRPGNWCHECKFFTPWTVKNAHLTMPESYNPCAKGHVMNFIIPDDIGEDYGFYLNVCRDRVNLEEVS